MTASPQALSWTDAQIEAMSAEEVLGWAYEAQGELPHLVLWQKQFSVLVHMISELGLDDIVELDTHLFFKETHETRELPVERYGPTLIVPEVLTIAEQHKVEGPNLWETKPDLLPHPRWNRSFGRWSPTMRGSRQHSPGNSRRHARTRTASSVPTGTACGRSSCSRTGRRRTSGATS